MSRKYRVEQYYTTGWSVVDKDAIKLSKDAYLHGANYVAIGAFYKTRTKKIRYKANIKTLN